MPSPIPTTSSIAPSVSTASLWLSHSDDCQQYPASDSTLAAITLSIHQALDGSESQSVHHPASPPCRLVTVCLGFSSTHAVNPTASPSVTPSVLLCSSHSVLHWGGRWRHSPPRMNLHSVWLLLHDSGGLSLALQGTLVEDIIFMTVLSSYLICFF